MKKFTIVLVMAMALFSCQPEGRVFVEHKELSPELEWLKKDAREFKVSIEDESILYDMGLSFRYANGYSFNVARVRVTETTPGGIISIKKYDLKVRDDNGTYLGEAGLDIFDSEHLVEPNKTFKEKGTYTFLIEQDMPDDPLNHAMEIGLIIDKAK